MRAAGQEEQERREATTPAGNSANLRDELMICRRSQPQTTTTVQVQALRTHSAAGVRAIGSGGCGGDGGSDWDTLLP